MTLELSVSPNARRLSAQEKTQFERDGYVKPLPVLSADGVRALQSWFLERNDTLPDDIDISKINNWHKASRSFYDICRTPAILDYVEDILGPNFVQWGGQFFVKYPGDGSVVPWHQDAQYWPLEPKHTITVWLAIFDANEANGAMKVVRASHTRGDLDHHLNDAPHLVLDQEIDETPDPEDVVTMNLRAGEISLHHDGIVHGSEPNHSDTIRCGMTMRFCPPEVRCDLSVWPNFETYPARGTDRLQLNPSGRIPTGESYPVERFQPSSDFTAIAAESA
jgi:ectoine hydroxylase-related dioxygenase (phytanoyl-CoA dioxygenase family)